MNQQMANAAAAGQNFDPNNQPFVQKTNTKDFDLELSEKVSSYRQNGAAEV